MIHRISIVLGMVMLMLTSVRVHAQETTRSLFEEIEILRSSANACADPALIGQVFNQIAQNPDIVSISDAAYRLSRERFWRAGERSGEHSGAINLLNEWSKTYPQLGNRIATALATADNELFEILAEGANLENQLIKLEKLLKNNAGQNSQYLIQIRYSIAEVLMNSVLSDINGQDIPLNPNEQQTNSERLNRAAGILGEIADHYKSSIDLTPVQQQTQYNSFTYLRALVNYIAGGDNWAGLLNGIAEQATTAKPGMYSLDSSASHIYVDNFVSANGPRTITQCRERVDASQLGGPAMKFGNSSNPSISRFFNPVQLAHYSCVLLSSDNPPTNLEDMAVALGAFGNHDYRVVLAHYRGEEMRFSNLTKDEFEDLAEAEVNSLDPPSIWSGPTDGDIFRNSAGSSVCGELPDFLDYHAELEILEQNTSAVSGYFYVGSGLSYEEALAIRSNLVHLLPQYEDSYLIRPQLD